MEAHTRSVLWFRHGLRLHDNPALLEAIKCENDRPVLFYPIFIFDGESAGTKGIGYNRLKYLLESLQDLDNQLRANGGKLYIFKGNPTNIFRRLWEKLGINKLCYEHDCEPVYSARDQDVVSLCSNLRIRCVEKVSHTLWQPSKVIQTNGGFPPLTYQMFLHTISVLGNPPRPEEDPNFDNVIFGMISDSLLADLNAFENVPTCEDLDVYSENTSSEQTLKWKGGETMALQMLENRVLIEEEAFRKGFYLPNQANPDILVSNSMSAALKHGCLSVRRFFYKIHDSFQEIQEQSVVKLPSGPHITGQLIWREYFYTMSVNNPNYDKMEGNPICLNIPWYEPRDDWVTCWKEGRTGFPLIDAAMRQLLAEGWIHHVLRNLSATFLTRGGLWYNWEIGAEHFWKYLIDADWSINAGNWMWVSSSAFEKLLDSSKCTCPVAFAKRLDPNGEYIKRYIPELRNIPTAYIHQPWKTPISIQESQECVIGIHYPAPIIDIASASIRNSNSMKAIRNSLIADTPQHVRPSNEDEIRQFFWLADEHYIEVRS